MTSGTSTGPITGNPKFTFGWSETVAAGGSFEIDFNEKVAARGSGGSAVPLPSSAAIALVGLAGLGAVGILQRRSSV